MSVIFRLQIRTVVTVGCLIVIVSALSGCAGVPRTPRDAKAHAAVEEDEDQGWLFDRLMGRKKPANGVTEAPAYDSGVRQASAIESLPVVDDAKAAKEATAAAGGTVLSSTLTEEEREQKEKEGSRGLSLEDLDPQNAYKKLLVATGFGPNKKIAQDLFAEGEALYLKKEYKEAAAKFKAAARRWPDSTLEEDAMFFQAESYFFNDQYSKAQDTLDNLMKKHENSRYLDRIVLRQYNIGQYWEKMHEAAPHWPVTPNLTDSSKPLFDTWGNALKAYESVAMNDPTGPLADDSIMAVANAYFKAGRYEDAAYYYERLRKEHPKSPHLVKAHLLGMKSQELVYQGPMYDAAALEDAGEIAETAITQFGRELGDQRKTVIEARNKIDAKMAERDWEMAQFWEGKKKYGGARFYYREIIKGYPNTAIAAAAQKRLAEIKDYPAKPPNRFKWLTDLFPDGR
ncbi:MAG: outer membrane protein assembly factor BamD [Pirellulales bacterium]|nr:outer membrane protein assembly factor BamD [Pirellulales bacterium]